MNLLRRLATSALVALAVCLAVSMPASAELLYVTMDNQTVTSYDISQSTATDVQNSAQTFLSLSFLPIGLAFDSASNVYVADSGANLIRKYSFSGTPLSTISTNTPLGLAMDANDNLYVANHNFNTVTKYNSSGGFVSSISSAVAQDVAFDSAGNIFISNGSPTNTVSKYNSSGTFLSTISGNMNNPYGLALDASANLFVANLNTNVSEFNSAGTFQRSLSPSSGDARANDTLVDSLGNLYVTNYYDNKISKFDSSGNFVFSWSTPSNPRFMAVPEPSTYAMALAGLACGGFSMWRRRKRTIC